jgi:hypothetical protein
MKSKILAIKHAVRGAPARPYVTDASRGIDRWVVISGTALNDRRRDHG